MSTVLDVAVGIVFLYLLLALIATTVQELIATFANSRANNLYDAIESMLRKEPNGGSAKGEPLVKTLYDHPLIRNLSKPSWFGKAGGVQRPSYIPSKTFAIALLDVLRQRKGLSEVIGARALLASASQIVEGIENHPQLEKALTLLLQGVADEQDSLDAKAARASWQIETWFNDRMARVSGWYKRRAQVISLILGLGVAVFFNADTIHVTRTLWQDGALRAAVAASAQTYYGAHETANGRPIGTVEDLSRSALERVNELQSSPLPIGWHWDSDGGVCVPKDTVDASSATDLKRTCLPPTPCEFWLMVLGWILTGLAVSLGSGFWFDVLGKVLQLRGTGAKISAQTGKVESDNA